MPLSRQPIGPLSGRATAALMKVGLGDRVHHHPNQMSGGQQQRVAIARALVSDPRVILADEPTGNLDSANGRHIIELLFDVNRVRKTTLVLVTHDPDLAVLAEVRLALRDGSIDYERSQLEPVARAR
jgi:putative ABC transport system ATP-binding protein